METDTSVKVVVSQEYVDQILVLDENIKSSKFAIGDILVLLVDENGGKKQEVCEYLQGATGLDWKTLADYETTSRRWSEDLRAEYAPMAYSVFRNTDPENPEHIAAIEDAIDHQLTARKTLDVIFQRDDALYVMRTIYGQMMRFLHIDKDYDQIIVLVQEKIDKLEKKVS